MSAGSVNIGSESETMEFKKSTGEMKEAIISMAAILNKHGKGQHYFGVRNDGEVIGQDVGEDTLRNISRAVHEHIKPAIYPSITKKTFGGRDVVEVSFEGDRAPYTAYSIPRIRTSDEDHIMDQETYEDMLRQRQSISKAWETRLSRYTAADVDRDSFDLYMRRSRDAGRISFPETDPSEVLARLGLLEGGHLLNAGAAIFVDSDINELQMAKFASDRKLTFTDIRRYTGSILSLVEKAVEYLVDAMDWRVEFDGSPKRREIPEIPVEALREAVVNAFAHRSIESRQSVEISIYRSYLDITSHGSFPAGVTPETFIHENVAPVRRNPLLARVLYYSKDMEGFATGLKRIQGLCDDARVKVEYECGSYYFRVRFYRHCSGTQPGTQPGTKSKEEMIIDMIRSNDKVTREEISAALGISVRTTQRLINGMSDIAFVAEILRM